MNITLLNTFLAIVECGSLVRAARQLNVTQSTVTARLNTLESDLGQALLVRQKSGVRLTSSGTKLLRYADVMTRLWQQARQETALPEGITAQCNIGCQPDLWPGLGGRLFSRIYQQHPDTAINIWPAEQPELDRWFGTGMVDAVLCYQPLTHNDQSITPLPADRLRLYSTQQDGPIRFDPDYVLVDYGDEFRRRHATAYADADTAKVTLGSALWAIEHLLENGGSAYLPERIAMSQVESGRLFCLDTAPEFSRQIYLVTNELAIDNWPWLPDMVRHLQLTDTGTEPDSIPVNNR